LDWLSTVTWSFDIAFDRLHEFAGMPIASEMSRRYGHGAAQVLT